MFGPPVSSYEHIDHLIWLISDASDWLPKKVRQVLINGLSDWGVWPWHSKDRPFENSFYNALLTTENGKLFRWSTTIKQDALSRFAKTKEILNLPESPEELFLRFKNRNFINKYMVIFKKRKNIHNRSEDL
jgi:hypothetical protein